MTESKKKIGKTKDKCLSFLLKRVLKAGRKFDLLKHEFDKKIVEKYGFHYSDRDLDYLIDSIDYCQADVSFEKFDEIMKEEGRKNKDDLND